MSLYDDEIRSEFAATLNRYSRENVSNTPDFILADVAFNAIRNYEASVNRREEWYGRKEANHE